MNTFEPSMLLPGDHLLYAPGCSIINRIICWKTWSPVCHIEIYAGYGHSWASRNMIGVGQYPVRLDLLAFVLRPKAMADFASGMRWFRERADGQGYDLAGLLVFYLAVKRGSQDRMFCSEFAARWDRFAGIDSFSLDWDADAIAPGNFLMSPAFTIAWRDRKYKLPTH